MAYRRKPYAAEVIANKFAAAKTNFPDNHSSESVWRMDGSPIRRVQPCNDRIRVRKVLNRREPIIISVCTAESYCGSNQP
jgi:hypothetical protein